MFHPLGCGVGNQLLTFEDVIFFLVDFGGLASFKKMFLFSLLLVLLLMEEILHHLGCIKPSGLWDIHHINWCRNSSIKSSREIFRHLFFQWIESTDHKQMLRFFMIDKWSHIGKKMLRCSSATRVVRHFCSEISCVYLENFGLFDVLWTGDSAGCFCWFFPRCWSSKIIPRNDRSWDVLLVLHKWIISLPYVSRLFTPLK